MKSESIALLRDLCELPGPPSCEDRVIDYMRSALQPCADEVIQDRLGGTFGVRRSSAPDAPKVMLAGHMDEVGFIVSRIDSDGLVGFKPLGGWWSQTLLSQRVTVHADGGDLTGVISTRAIRQDLSADLKSRALEIDDMIIDVGAQNAAHAARLGLRPGVFVTPQSDFVRLGGGSRLLGKAFDNRYGCATAIDAMRALASDDLPCHLYAGATVQEEGGLRGALPAARLIQPDLFIALDSSAARDVSGKPGELGRLGEGFLLRVFDSRMRPDRALIDFTRKLAEEHGIRYQWFFSHGTTDAAAVQTSGIGVPTLVLGIACRYNHSHTAIIDTADYDASLAIVVELVRRFDAATVRGLTCR
ncbi:MAG: M42 family peptidase [Spirochaetaceae bacterium]|nr:MAG: M42 family peptidase [Spirochaetaceae bacterium]